MCRSIKTLFNFDPPATQEEIHEASKQFVKKISGFNKPSKVNENAYSKAVKDIEKISQELLFSLRTDSESRSRETEAIKAHERAIKRFGFKK